MTTTLLQMPSSSIVRSGSGAIAADSAVLSLANYPFALGFNPGSRVGKILVNWTAGGVVTPTDWLDLQVLIYDGLRTVPGWVEGHCVYGVRFHQAVEMEVLGASLVAVRIAAINCAAGTDVVVRAAQANYLS